MSVGYFLKAKRLELRMSRREFAKKCKVNYTQITLYENDKVKPSKKVAIRLAKELDLPEDFFLKEEAIMKETLRTLSKLEVPNRYLELVRSVITIITDDEKRMETTIH